VKNGLRSIQQNKAKKKNKLGACQNKQPMLLFTKQFGEIVTKPKKKIHQTNLKKNTKNKKDEKRQESLFLREKKKIIKKLQKNY